MGESDLGLKLLTRGLKLVIVLFTSKVLPIFSFFFKRMDLKDFNESEFNEKALELLKISEQLNDNWKINEKNEKFYLSKKKTISVSKTIEPPEDCNEYNYDPALAHTIRDDLISIEYHVLFHPSFQVPALYFNAYSGKRTGLVELYVALCFKCQYLFINQSIF